MENLTIHSYIADGAQLDRFRDLTISQVWVPMEVKDSGSFLNAVQSLKWEDQVMGWTATSAKGAVLGWVHCPYAAGDALAARPKRFSYLCSECGHLPPVPSGFVLEILPEWNCPECGENYFDTQTFMRTISSVEATTLGEMVYGDLRSAGCPVADFNADPWRVDPDENEHRVWWNTRYPEHPWDPSSKRKQWCWKVGLGGPRAKLLLQKVKEGETS